MTKSKLPIKLNKEPLVDAVFEIRFSSKLMPASNVLPGLFVEEVSNIERLPQADLPRNLRENDPNLLYQPLLRLRWKGFLIDVGDNSISVLCPLPYPGWQAFKGAVSEVVGRLRTSPIINEINRYSMKYVDVIEGKDQKELINRLNLHLNVGANKLVNNVFSITIEVMQKDLLHLVRVAAPIKGTTIDGKQLGGLVVDIDSIYQNLNLSMEQFVDGLSDRLETLHQCNKEMFFDCLTEETIEYLEPVYE